MVFKVRACVIENGNLVTDKSVMYRDYIFPSPGCHLYEAAVRGVDEAVKDELLCQGPR